jgi:two-component system LytT family response regulator
MTSRQIEKIRALIVDDEPLARRGIRQSLQSFPDVEIIGECKNGREAVAAIEKQKPDLIFLDVQMPLLDGFGVIREMRAENLPPVVVFVTAFDEHAIRAFEINALDYLLKPVDPERFKKTMERVREQIRNKQSVRFDEKLLALLRDVESLKGKEAPREYLRRVVIKESGRVFFLDANEIDWISAEGNYVKLHAKNKTHLLRETMDGIERKLNPQEFLRLRRSTIVRIECIKELQPLFKGEFVVVLKDGTNLSSSRRYRQNLDSLLKS